MKKKSLIFITGLLLSLLYSCQNKDMKLVNTISQEALNEIERNKSNIVFLQLYPAVSNEAYNYLLRKEAYSNDKVIYDPKTEKFIYQMKIKDSLFDFKILNNPDNIELNLSKEVYVKDADRKHSDYKIQYLNILEFLLQVFEKKYTVKELSKNEYYNFFEADVFDKFANEKDSIINEFIQLGGNVGRDIKNQMKNELYLKKYYSEYDNFSSYYIFRGKSDNFILFTSNFNDNRIDKNSFKEYNYNVYPYEFKFSYYTKDSYERMKADLNKQKLEEIEVEQEKRDKIKMKSEKERNDVIGNI